MKYVSYESRDRLSRKGAHKNANRLLKTRSPNLQIYPTSIKKNSSNFMMSDSENLLLQSKWFYFNKKGFKLTLPKTRYLHLVWSFFFMKQS